MPQLEDDVTVPSWLGFLLKAGASTGLAIYFAYFVTASLAADLHALRDGQIAHAQASLQLQLSADRNERLQEAIIGLLRTQCVNQADDYVKRQACLAVGTH